MGSKPNLRYFDGTPHSGFKVMAPPSRQRILAWTVCSSLGGRRIYCTTVPPSVSRGRTMSVQGHGQVPSAILPADGHPGPSLTLSTLHEELVPDFLAPGQGSGAIACACAGTGTVHRPGSPWYLTFPMGQAAGAREPPHSPGTWVPGCRRRTGRGAVSLQHARLDEHY